MSDVVKQIKEEINDMSLVRRIKENIETSREQRYYSKRKKLLHEVRHLDIKNDDIWLNLIGSYNNVTYKEIERITHVLKRNKDNGRCISVADVCNEAELGEIPRKEFSDFIDVRRGIHKFLNNVCFNYNFPENESVLGHYMEKRDGLSSLEIGYYSVLHDIYKLVSVCALHDEITLLYGKEHPKQEFFITMAGRSFRGVTWNLFAADILPHMEKDDLVIPKACKDINYLGKADVVKRSPLEEQKYDYIIK